MDPTATPGSTFDAAIASGVEVNNHNPRSQVYICQECGRGMTRRDSLLRHARVIHRIGQNFWCQEPECMRINKGFRLFHNYSRHMWAAHRVVVTTNDLHGVPAPVEQNSSHVDERQTAPQVTPSENWPQMDVKPESKNMSQHVPQYQSQLVPQYKSEHEPQYQAQYQPQATHVHQSTPAYMPDLYYGNGPAHPPEDGFGMELGISASAGTQAHPAPNDLGEWSYFNPLWEQPRRQM